MKPSIKAALLSALVFPGIGHFSLRRPGRGCLFLLPTLVAAIYVGRQVLQQVNLVMDKLQDGSMPLDPQLLADQLSSAPGSDSPMMTIASIVCVLCWAGSIIDALLIGAKPAPKE